MTPLNSSQLEVFLRIFWNFSIFWNLNLGRFKTGRNRNQSGPVRPVTAVTGPVPVGFFNPGRNTSGDDTCHTFFFAPSAADPLHHPPPAPFSLPLHWPSPSLPPPPTTLSVPPSLASPLLPPHLVPEAKRWLGAVVRCRSGVRVASAVAVAGRTSGERGFFLFYYILIGKYRQLCMISKLINFDPNPTLIQRVPADLDPAVKTFISKVHLCQ